MPGIHGGPGQPKHVAGALAHHDVRLRPRGASGFETTAEPGDVGVERTLGRRRRRVPPERADDPLGGYDASAGHGQQGEHAALTATTEVQPDAVALGTDLAQDPKLKARLPAAPHVHSRIIGGAR